MYFFLSVFFFFFLNKVSPPELEQCMRSGTVVVGLGTVKRSHFRFEQHFFLKGKEIPKIFKKKKRESKQSHE